MSNCVGVDVTRRVPVRLRGVCLTPVRRKDNLETNFTREYTANLDGTASLLVAMSLSPT